MARIIQSKYAYTRVSGSSFAVTLDQAPGAGNTLVVIAFGNNNTNIQVGVPTSPAGWAQDAKQGASGGQAVAIVVGHRAVVAGDGKDLQFAGTTYFPQDIFVGVWEIYGTPVITAAAGTSGAAGGIATSTISPSGNSSGDVVLAGFGVGTSATWGAISPSQYSLLGDGAGDSPTSAAFVQAAGTSLPNGAASIAYSSAYSSGGGIWAYATAPVEDPDAPQYFPYLIIPSGESQTISELDGHSSLGTIDASTNDPGGQLKALAAQSGVVGLKALLRMGFPGMTLAQFQTMHTMQLISVKRDPTGLLHFSLADPQRFLMKQMWTYGGPAAWSPGDVTPSQPAAESWLPNTQPISDQNPRYVQGNPLDIYLVAAQNEAGLGQNLTAAPATWTLYTPGDDSTLISTNRDLDVETVKSLRDGQFSGVWFEFKLTSSQDGKSWLEDQILKPLGLCHIVLPNGQLSLKSMKQPVATSTYALTDDNIIGTPDTDFWPVTNVVKVTPGTPDGSQGTPLVFIDDASDEALDQQAEQDVQGDGLRTLRGAFALGELLSDQIFRRHAGSGIPVPIYSVKTMLSMIDIHAGDFVTLTHRLLLDYKTGLVGVTGVLCEVIDRNPDYQTASAGNTLKLADTRFMKFMDQAYSVAPSGTPDWTSATDSDKASYCFIAGSDGLMSDGSAGRTIF